MIFWGKIVSYLLYLGQGEDFKLTTELSEKVQCPTTSGQYKTWTADYGLRTGYKIRTRYKTRTGKWTGYKIEILGGGSLNQEPDKNAMFFTHFRHGLGL